MPSTHLSLNYHIVFSTKNREPILAASWRAELMPILEEFSETWEASPRRSEE